MEVAPLLPGVSSFKLSSSDARDHLAARMPRTLTLDACFELWAQLMEAADVGSTVGEMHWSRLRDAMLEPWRHYHTLAHVVQMIQTLKTSTGKKS